MDTRIRYLVEKIFEIKDQNLRNEILLKIQAILNDDAGKDSGRARDFHQSRVEFYNKETEKSINERSINQFAEFGVVVDREKFKLIEKYLSEILFVDHPYAYIVFPDYSTFHVPLLIKVTKNKKRWACNMCNKIMEIGGERITLSIGYFIRGRDCRHTFSFCNQKELKSFLEKKYLRTAIMELRGARVSKKRMEGFTE